MSAPTPGPWFVEKSSSDFYYITSDPDAFAPALAQTWNAGVHVHEQEANARLLAAAPELLAALKRNRAALDLIDPDRPLQYATTMDLMRRDLDAAIAKVEAQS